MVMSLRWGDVDLVGSPVNLGHILADLVVPEWYKPVSVVRWLITVESGPSTRRVTRRDYTKTTRLWGLCLECRAKWQWSGRTEDVWDGMKMIGHSGCMCQDANPDGGA